ncbi:MAG: hydantoinase B/oxoprolinase family protein [Alphaproteobacteria bacterium]|nr:hydantoinase B/oxoprolinase family protein [Alphaproteobacteria bacterium]
MINLKYKNNKWDFWIDRGGTFTDIVAIDPKGVFHIKKILSHNPSFYKDSIIEGIRQFLKTKKNKNICSNLINEVRIGTTVATNTLLTKTGDKTCLFITKGFKDSLKIGDQSRADIFARRIISNKMLYNTVYEISERLSNTGKVLVKIDIKKTKILMRKALNRGYKSAAIVLIHAWKYPKHEKILKKIAIELGFKNVCISYDTAPLIGLNARGDTTVVDAYLTPKLNRYTKDISINIRNTNILYMQSTGGLTSSSNFNGKDAVLSGPAGGVIAAVETNKLYKNYGGIIGLDMGGTSTDVFHYKDQYERSHENIIADNKIKVPMLNINTIAAGGGSIIKLEGSKIIVGPKSAGASPGPACYGIGGHATITDCNLLLGYIQPNNFPKIFGKQGNEPLSRKASTKALKKITNEIQKLSKDHISIYELAMGSISIANESMANAIRKISIEKGHDIEKHALVGYGAAAGQHICNIADSLNLKTIIMHPFSSVLSAYGMGFAELKVIKTVTIEKEIYSKYKELNKDYKKLEQKGKKELKVSNPLVKLKDITITKTISLKYNGTDSFIRLEHEDLDICIRKFKNLYKKQFGFLHLNRSIIIDNISSEVSIPNNTNHTSIKNLKINYNIKNEGKCLTYIKNKFQKIESYNRDNLKIGDYIKGPSIVYENNTALYISELWNGCISKDRQIIISKTKKKPSKIINNKKVDPIRLEIFNNMFMALAEEMGTVLKNTAYSINIKERLDFSCALFDKKGRLIANAPHIPIHLGSMGESIKYVIHKNKNNMNNGDSFIHNNPYTGGTHLPDITVITPIFISYKKDPDFFVASRAHHSDIGGSTPGSMPAMSKNINEEGAVFNGEKIVKKGRLNYKIILKIFNTSEYPARDTNSNFADLAAQLAASNSGKNSINRMVNKYSLNTINAYMKHVTNNAEDAIKIALSKLKNGKYETLMDNGSKIKINIIINKKYNNACFDFTGSSKQTTDNFNAPIAVTKSAILYILRTLIEKKIPLNDGCLKPIKIIIPNNSILRPKYPAAVVAGNVETSQTIVDTINNALKIQAACYGTMSNFTFGSSNYGYYETICGGEGASINHNGASAVQCHMTNTRMTDPEILELRYPVKINNFSIRKNSGGKGLFNGGDGVIREIEFYESMTAVILSNRRKIAPHGILNGEDALKGINLIKRRGKGIKKLNSSETINVKPGDTIIIKTPGGGGYGKKATL